MNCPKCNNSFVDKNGLSYHMSIKHDMKLKNWEIKHSNKLCEKEGCLNKVHPSKSYCSRECMFNSLKYKERMSQSSKCRWKSQKGKNYRDCATCGKKIQSWKKYCSHECFSKNEEVRKIRSQRASKKSSLVEWWKNASKEERRKRNKKVSKTRKELISSGEIRQWTDMVSQEEKDIVYKKLSQALKKIWEDPEKRRFQSELISQKIIDGELVRNCTDFVSGWFFSQKSNKKMYYRSSWELKVLEYLEKSNKVRFFDTEPFAIDYKLEEQAKKYVPDILITYVNGSRCLCEIKPEFFFNEITLIKIEAAKKWCEENHAKFQLVSNNEIENLESIL